MKILEQGNNHIEVPKKITCGNCASILEYLKEDIKQITESRFDPRDGAPYNTKVSVIVCQVCNKNIKV